VIHEWAEKSFQAFANFRFSPYETKNSKLICQVENKNANTI
jgi:hypothetical protein